MRTRPSITSLFALGLFSTLAFSARLAAAESCASDADCVKGWSCQVTGGSGCASACAPGEKCETPPECVTQEYKSCVPAPCQSDNDCASDMVCYTHTSSVCSAAPCSSDAPCPPTSCETKTDSACIPRYLLPCTAAADCGAGFRCVADQESCTCAGSAPSGNGSGSGSGGGASSDDGATPPPTPTPEPDCTCVPSNSSSCQAIPVTCSSAADCTAGWTCETSNIGSDCGSSSSDPGSGPAAGGGVPTPGAAPEPADGGASKPADGCGTPVTSVRLCMPPYYSLVGSRGVGDKESATPGDVQSGGSSDPSVPPVAAHDGSSATSTAAGCSVAFGSRASAAGALLFALGLSGMLRRRRSRSAAR